jgi:uncharacterized protein (TIGR03437 family)
MKRSAIYCCAVLSLATAAATGASAQTPTIGAITHAATYSPPGIPNSAIPQGGFFSLFTSNAGPSTGTFASGAFTTSLSSVTVNITPSSGSPVQALLYFVYSGQINGVLPSNTATGSATVTVTYNGSTSAAFPFTVVSSNFGFFTLNAGGTGPAIAQSYPTYALNSLTATAKPGDTLIFYGTGLGPAVGNQDETTAGGAGGYGTDLRSVDNLDFHMYLGGIEVTSGVLYAGRSPDVALDQINLTIPSNFTITGCFVPVIIRIGSIVSNSASIAINANNQTCSDPYGLTSAQITQASTGTLKVGSVLLTRLALNLGLPVPITEDDAEAHFYSFSGGNILDNASFLALSSFGSCQITNCSNTYTCVPSATGLPVAGLNAGSALSVSGNGAPTTSVPSVSTGYYDTKLGSYPLAIGTYPINDFLVPGSYSVSGSGGSDVQSFSTSVTVPGIPNFTSGAFTFTSPQFSSSQENVSRSSDLTVNWSNAGSAGYMLISVGSAANVGTTASPIYNSTTITCLQPVGAGTFTVPSWMLEALPASASVNLGAITAPGAAVLLRPD